MLTKGMKKLIERFIIEECDDIIIDIMKEKLNVEITQNNSEVEFKVTFADYTIAKDKIDLKDLL